ncbi:MAG: gliding motility lipoprotein GldH [Bacteroidota bacterium]|nr:gliding motility lipoprotein GldH [Bacteroidota bacterium]
MKKLLIIPFLSILVLSCVKIELFEKQAQIPSQQWFYNYVPQFTFHIEDTSSMYNVYIVLRHTDLYNYNNIWLRMGTKAPGDSMQFQNMNLVLAHDAMGWEGSGMDDIYEVRKNISRGPASFKKPGDYTFSIAQIMRENPLKYILNVGIRVEKVKM